MITIIVVLPAVEYRYSRQKISTKPMEAMMTPRLATLCRLVFAIVAIVIFADKSLAEGRLSPPKDLNDVIQTAVVAAVFGAMGWFLAYWLGGRREDRIRRLQITLDQTATQLREFYAPLVALTDHLDSMAQVNDGATAGRKDNKVVNERMFRTHFTPIHEEIVVLLKTKNHLWEGRDNIQSSLYFKHYVAQKVYWDFFSTSISLNNMGWPDYPEQFFIRIRNDYDAVKRRYEDCLKELRHRALPFID